MKKRLLALSLALAVSAQAAPTQAAPMPAVTAQDLFDEVIYQLASFYNGPSTLRASDLRRKYLPQVQGLCGGKAQCPSEEAYPVIRALLTDLKDIHTNFVTPTQLAELDKTFTDGQTERKTFGAVTEALGSGGRVVLEVVPESAAGRAGWRVGDVLRQVNGVPLDGAAGLAAWSRVAAQGTPARFTGTRQGQPLNTTATAALLKLTPVSQTTRPDGITIVRLRHFNTPGVAQQVHDAMRKVQGTKGVILDLRWNGGGRVEEFLLSAGAFTDPAPLFLKTRVDAAQLGYSEGRYLVNGKTQEQPRINNPVRYTGPLAVLVDGDTASSAEFLTRTLLGRPSTQVIGEATAGAGDTATLFRPLADGSGLQLTFAKVLDAQQNLLGTRISPPVQVSLDAKELARTGKDSVMERAAQLLAK